MLIKPFEVEFIDKETMTKIEDIEHVIICLDYKEYEKTNKVLLKAYYRKGFIEKKVEIRKIETI